MSLRAYFDKALEQGQRQNSGAGRRQALGATVKTGADAARHLQQAQESLKKIRAQQERRKQHA